MNGSLLTIVMYHYVRPIAGSRYPGIKGLEVDAFDGQLDYLEKHYVVVRPSDVLASLDGGAPLPGNAALLTFDDGYRDHFQYVYPRLRARGHSAVFFPPTDAILNRRPLDVNRIQFVLASGPDTKGLVKEVETAIQEAPPHSGLESLEDYRGSLRAPSRFDEPDVVYVKRLLQHALPESLRAEITRRLFSKYVTNDELSFGNELYLRVEEIKEMAAGGMAIGSHGHRHHWLARLDALHQAEDIDRSIGFLRTLGGLPEKFWFCYPYGSYNAETLRLLKERNCGAAVTTVPGLATCEPDRALELPRLDTNDLPRSRDAAPSSWTPRRGPNAHGA